MKKIQFILLLFISSTALSQNLSIGFRAGIGTYSMSSLDLFQQFRTNQVELPFKITESYPATPFYSAELALNDLKYIDKIGLFYRFYSTGARSTVSDYSGRADLDAVINGNQLGLNIQKAIYKNGHWSYGFYAEGGYLLSHLKTSDNLAITYPEKVSEKQDYSFKSTGYTAEPGIVFCYRLSPVIIQANLGYMFDFSQKLHLDGNKDMILGTNNGPVSPQWSGLRFSLQVSYLFKKRPKN